jgi:hypothetical protein
LALETSLLAQPESSGAFSTLYDMDNPQAASLAAQRREDPAYAARSDPQVVSVTITRDDSSQTYATAEVTRSENGQLLSEIVEWRLVGGTWKRVN